MCSSASQKNRPFLAMELRQSNRSSCIHPHVYIKRAFSCNIMQSIETDEESENLKSNMVHGSCRSAMEVAQVGHFIVNDPSERLRRGPGSKSSFSKRSNIYFHIDRKYSKNLLQRIDRSFGLSFKAEILKTMSIETGSVSVRPLSCLSLYPSLSVSMVVLWSLGRQTQRSESP